MTIHATVAIASADVRSFQEGVKHASFAGKRCHQAAGKHDVFVMLHAGKEHTEKTLCHANYRLSFFGAGETSPAHHLPGETMFYLECVEAGNKGRYNRLK